MSIVQGINLIAGSVGSPVIKKIIDGNVELEDNIILRGETLTTLGVIIPTGLASQFICEIDFTSGSIATAFTAPSNIKWFGDDTESGALVPVANSRYVLIFFNDGVNIRGISQKVGA